MDEGDLGPHPLEKLSQLHCDGSPSEDDQRGWLPRQVEGVVTGEITGVGEGG